MKVTHSVIAINQPWIVKADRSGLQEPVLRVKASASAPPANLSEKTDDVLITLFQGGEEAAFRILVLRYQERIRNLIYSIFHDPELVDDLAQEVFIKAYQALKHFRFESSFYTWIYRIAVNKSRDEMRRRKIRKWLSFRAAAESGDREFREKTSVHQENNETRELVTKGLDLLPEKYRLAIVLKDLDGFSYEEMSEVMQCELGTVKSRLSRARAMLRTVLKPLLDEVER